MYNRSGYAGKNAIEMITGNIHYSVGDEVEIKFVQLDDSNQNVTKDLWLPGKVVFGGTSNSLYIQVRFFVRGEEKVVNVSPSRIRKVS